MKTNQFHYDCPVELIAQSPTVDRAESRLLVFGHDRKIQDERFYHLPSILNAEFGLKQNNKKLLLIGNNSKVYPARVNLYRSTGAQCEIFILETGSKETYSCLIRPKSKLKQNEILYLQKNAQFPVFKLADFKNSKVQPLFDEPIEDFLDKHGSTPLPPYIKRDENSTHVSLDKTRYQNVYANQNHLGSCAAPTAGFHFTDELLQRLPEYQIDIAYLTLHVGLGTFLPVKTENIHEHHMHEENYLMSHALIQKIFEFIENGWPIIFIGTTSLRTVESFFRMLPHPFKKEDALVYADKWHSTQLFLYPEDENSVTKPLIGQGIITNFHQPESSLLMLIASLVGFHNLKTIYTHAVNHKYKFFSYGDSSLLIF